MSERERFNRALKGLAYAEWQGDRALVSDDDSGPLQALLVAVDMTILPRFLQVRNSKDKALFTIHTGNRRLLEFVDPGSAYDLKDFNGLIAEGPDAMDEAACRSLAYELETVLGDGQNLRIVTHRGLTDDHAGGIGIRADRLAQTLDIPLYGGKAQGVADPITHVLKSPIMARFGWMHFSGTELVQSGAPAADRLEDLNPETLAVIIQDILSAAAPDQAAEFLILGNTADHERLVLCGAGQERLFTCLPEAEALDLLALWDKDIAPGLG